jgi:hypothetical protein
MTDAGIIVSWQLSTEQWTNLVRVVNRAGVDAMVRFAVATKKASRQEIRFASFFLRSGWLGLPPQSTRASPNGVPRQQLPHCGECDPDTRLREVLRDGLPELTPCPDCHPVTQGAPT